MGGGGGSYPLSDRLLKSLEEKARQTIKEGAVREKRNVFISFASEDIDEVNLLRGQAKNANSELEFKDYSLKVPFDSKNADYIKRGIRERINQCSVTVVFLSDATANSKWVDWEIRESICLEKGVVALYKGDSVPSKLPPALNELKIKPVKWNHEEIMKAIKKASQ